MSKIAVLIPCYNEAETIAQVVADFQKALPQADIYVYDNNSSDNTAQLAEQAGAIVRYEYRQGKGNVIRSMFREIEADCYLIIDGDDTYPAESAAQMCDIVLEGRGDMVIGDRLSSTYFKENKRALHGAGNLIVRKLINIIFNNDIKDIMTGYRAFSRDFVKGFPLLSKGFEVETEMTIHALDKNFLIREVVIPYRDRPQGSESKLNTYSDGAKVLGTIFMLFRDYRPLLFFSIVAVVMLLCSVLLFIPILMEYLSTGFVPRFPTLIICAALAILAMLMWVCGVILDVIVKGQRQLYELLRLKR
ncbi:MAG: glycosyltransferase family 2 protein [Rikenellaceae bacterium]